MTDRIPERSTLPPPTEEDRIPMSTLRRISVRRVQAQAQMRMIKQCLKDPTTQDLHRAELEVLEEQMHFMNLSEDRPFVLKGPAAERLRTIYREMQNRGTES